MPVMPEPPPEALAAAVRGIAADLIAQAGGRLDAALEAAVDAADATPWARDPARSQALLDSLGSDAQRELLTIADHAGYRLSEFRSVGDLCRLLASHHVEHRLRQEIARRAAA